MPEGERVNVYLPHTLARDIRAARAAGVDLNLSEAAARGIRQHMNGDIPANGGVDQAHDGEYVASDRIYRQLQRAERVIGQLTALLAVVILATGATLAFISLRTAAAA